MDFFFFWFVDIVALLTSKPTSPALPLAFQVVCARLVRSTRDKRQDSSEKNDRSAV